MNKLKKYWSHTPSFIGGFVAGALASQGVAVIGSTAHKVILHVKAMTGDASAKAALEALNGKA